MPMIRIRFREIAAVLLAPLAVALAINSIEVISQFVAHRGWPADKLGAQQPLSMIVGYFLFSLLENYKTILAIMLVVGIPVILLLRRLGQYSRQRLIVAGALIAAGMTLLVHFIYGIGSESEPIPRFFGALMISILQSPFGGAIGFVYWLIAEGGKSSRSTTAGNVALHSPV